MIKKLIQNDVYWGEFSEEKMDTLLAKCGESFAEARAYIAELGRTEFIFGMGRSDFLYYTGINKDSVCLDCGCGLGAHTFNMARIAGEVHAFDQSLKRLQFVECRARAENIENIELYHSDFEHLPFEENTFDVILMNGIVEWLGEIHKHDNPRDDQVAVLKQLHKLLKPGGVLYIGIENRYAAAYLRGHDHNGIRFTNFFPRFLANLVTRMRKGKPYRTYTYSRAGYRALLRDAGFGDVSYYVAYPSYNEPRYLIPFDSVPSLTFFMQHFWFGKGIRGLIAALAGRIPFVSKLVRHFVWSFALFAKKV